VAAFTPRSGGGAGVLGALGALEGVRVFTGR